MKKIIFATAFWLLTAASFAQIQTKIVKDSLPSSVKEKLHSKFHDYSVANIVMITDKNGTVTYKLEARREKAKDGTSTVYINYLTYDSSGKLLSKVKDKEIYYTDTPKQKTKPTKSNDGHGGHQH